MYFQNKRIQHLLIDFWKRENKWDFITIRFPNGLDETYLFIDPDRFDGCGWLTCADDYVESEPYVDIVGFVPLDNVRIIGDQIVADFKGFFPPELIDFYWKYLGFEKPKTVAEAIDECNKALKDKPELDFSGVKMVKWITIIAVVFNEICRYFI